MNTGFYRRLFEVNILQSIIALQFFAAYFLFTRLESQTFFILFKIVFAGVCIAFLTNSQLFSFLQSKFPALKRYVIRSILVGCLLLIFAARGAPFGGDIFGYILMGSLVTGCLLFGFAQIAAMLGR